MAINRNKKIMQIGIRIYGLRNKVLLSSVQETVTKLSMQVRVHVAKHTAVDWVGALAVEHWVAYRRGATHSTAAARRRRRL